MVIVVSVLLKLFYLHACCVFGLVNRTDGAKGHLNDIVSVIRFSLCCGILRILNLGCRVQNEKRLFVV